MKRARKGGKWFAFRALLSLLVATVTLSGGLDTAGGFDANVTGGARVEVLRSDDAVVEVRVRFPSPVTRPAEGRGPPGLTVPGLPADRVVGRPAWPYHPVLLTLPPGATFDLEVDDPAARSLPGRRPVPVRAERVGDGSDASATDTPRASPPDPVEIDIDGWLRSRRVVRLLFRPLTPAENGGSIHHPVLTARLRLSDAGGAATGVFRPDGETVRIDSGRRPVTGAGARPDPFARLYTRVLANENRVDDARYRRASERRASTVLGTASSTNSGTTSMESSGGSGPPAAKIPVRDEGIWSVFHADLLAAGIDAGGGVSADLALSAGGIAVPLRVLDGGDGTFDAGDRVEFVGTGVTGDPDTETNIYRLTFDAGSGLSPATRDATPAGGFMPAAFTHRQRFELDEQLWTSLSDSDGDHFTWRTIQKAGAAVTSGFTFALTDRDPVAADVRFRFRLLHASGPTHVTDLLLNGQPLLDSRSWGSGDVTHDVTVPAGLLAGGAETLTVELDGSGVQQILANWFEVDYARLFLANDDRLIFSTDHAAPVAYSVGGFSSPDIVAWDVTDPGAPVLLTGGQVSGVAPDHVFTFTDTVGGPRRFAVRAGTALPPQPLELDEPSSWQDPSNGADLIIVSHPDFLPELAPLVAARQAQGLRVALVDVTDAYDEFGHGRVSRAAIRDLVATAYASWQAPAPAYVLLVGNATLDPRRRLTNPASLPLMMPSGTFDAPTLGMASTDNYFVAVAGSDPLPDLHVGRLPAQTPADVAAAVAKTLDYESVPLENLNRKVLLVADDDTLNFETLQEDLVNLYLAPTRLPVARAYLAQLGVAATRTAIRDEMDDGALVVNYLGHGNIHNWAAEDIFVDTVDIPALSNIDRPYFLTTMNCINGLHAAPRGSNATSLAEMAVLEPGRGAVAAWSPTALGTLTDYAILSKILFRQIFTDRIQNLGAVTTGAKVEAYTVFGVSVANVEEMTLFGDPSLNLRVDGDRDGLDDATEDGCACGLDARDADTDDDGLLDGLEPSPAADSDGDGVIDAADPDADNDGLPDGLEAGIAVADADTALAAGHFLPDADPATTTDPRSADTDGGGAADGAEDRNADGQVDGADTDPNNPGDDAVCAVSPPEIAWLDVTSSGPDLHLTWSDVTAQDPCALYRVLQADLGTTAPASLPPFSTAAVSAAPQATLPGELAIGGSRMYLVVTTRPDTGDGPSGH